MLLHGEKWPLAPPLASVGELIPSCRAWIEYHVNFYQQVVSQRSGGQKVLQLNLGGKWNFYV